MKSIPLIFLLTVSGNLLAEPGGSLTPPPGAPAPTMKSLNEVEPRIAITTLPYTISGPGSYYLTKNLTVETGHAILVTASNVKLNLNGFTLSSTGSEGSDRGVFVSSGAALFNVTVTNGTIQGFSSGISFDGVNNGTIKNLRLSDLRYTAIQLRASDANCDGNTIADCSIYNVERYGIIFDSDNHQCNGNTISHCTIMKTNIGSAGIFLDGRGGKCNGNTISHCTLLDIKTYGIIINAQNSGEASGNTISHCRVIESGTYGIYIVANLDGKSAGNVIEHCQVNGSGKEAITLKEADLNHIHHNMIRAAGDNGIYLTSSSRNTIEGNSVIGSIPVNGTSRGINIATVYNLIIKNYCSLNEGNFRFNGAADDPDNKKGPVITPEGTLSNTGPEAHPWANFSIN